MSLNIFKDGQLVKIAGLNYTDVAEEFLSYLTANDDLIFQFSKDNNTGRYGYLDENGDFVPFRSAHTLTYVPTIRDDDIDMGENHEYRYLDTTDVPNLNTDTYTVTTKSASEDMGETNEYRYVDTSGIPNANTQTYTPTTRDTLDMGETNEYRYVNTTSVPNTNSDTYTPTTRAASIDMGATNTYRYVTTTSVPNTNSGTYSITSNGTKDMGETNTYRYASVSVYPTSLTSVASSVSNDHNNWTVSVTNGDYYIFTAENSSSVNSPTITVTGGTKLTQINFSRNSVILVKATSTSLKFTSSYQYGFWMSNVSKLNI